MSFRPTYKVNDGGDGVLDGGVRDGEGRGNEGCTGGGGRMLISGAEAKMMTC